MGWHSRRMPPEPRSHTWITPSSPDSHMIRKESTVRVYTMAQPVHMHNVNLPPLTRSFPLGEKAKQVTGPCVRTKKSNIILK